MSPQRFPVFHFTWARRRRIGLAACLLGNLLMLSGCAKDPPNSGTSSALSGKRLVVTLQFQDVINPNFHYFFLINYANAPGATPGAGDKNALGPIAVLEPLNIGAGQSYGNGFATSASTVGGFTDFVKFENNSYRLMHVVGDPTANNTFVDEGQPVAFTLPAGGKTLHFELDLAQLVVASNGSSLNDPTQTVNIAKNILQWLQINIVATDVIPANQATLVAKQVDSLGNTQTASGASSFLTLDMTQFTTYNNQSFAGQAVFEPASPDVFVTGGNPPDESLDLVDYTIQVVQK